MDASDLAARLALGEDSKTQFKETMSNAESLAAELVAFSNGSGGTLFVGVRDDASVAGIDAAELRRLNLLISNAASQGVRPAANPVSENIATSSGVVVAITVLEGASKPYMDKDGIIWVKSGADKRRATSREEIQRMFQNSGLIHGDEIPVRGLTTRDVDLGSFGAFYEKVYGEAFDPEPEGVARLFRDMNLASDEWLNVAGTLLFAKLPSSRLPVFTIKAISYPGTGIDLERYSDSQDLLGTVQDQYRAAIAFILRDLRHLQGDRNINSEGEPEIPRLASHASKLLPYRGLGSGISRALKAWPRIDFVDDRDGNLFKAVVFFGDSN